MSVLRDATAADAATVHRLVRGLAEYEKMLDKYTASVADIGAAMAAGHFQAILASPDAGGEPVGVALYYYTFATFACRRNMFLEDLFVVPEARGQGHGLALLRALARKAVAEDCARIDWHVLEWNAPSIAFYAAIGATRMTEWHVRQLQGDALVALAQGT